MVVAVNNHGGGCGGGHDNCGENGHDNGGSHGDDMFEIF